MPSQNHANNPALSYGFNLSENGWDGSYNNNFRALGVFVHLSVLSRTVDAQPGTPSNGDRYIIPASASGAQWAGQDGKVGAFIDNAWHFFTPFKGWSANVEDENLRVEWSGTAWAYPGTPAKTAADAGATISANNASYILVSNTGAQSVTNFTGSENVGMRVGQRLALKFADANTTLQNGSLLVLAGAVNYNPPAGARMELICTGFSSGDPIMEECWRQE
jgi:hypothetical protein